MEGYCFDSFVDIHDVDLNGVARASALMRYFQSAAQMQLGEQGMTYDELKRRHRVFVLSQFRMEAYAPLYAYEAIRTQTYPCESRGFSFPRCYRLFRGEELIAEAVSVWALLDTEAGGLVRVSDFSLPVAHGTPIELTSDRIVLPSGMREVGSARVRYADVDQNAHLNNTRYPDLYADFLPMEGKRIRSLSIRYPKEAPMGQMLRVERGTDGGEWFFRTLREDGAVNSEAKLRLADL